MEGEERLKREAGYSRLVGDGSNEPGNLRRRLLWDTAGRADLYTLHQHLKIYIEALPGVSHVYRPGGLKDTLPSQGCVLEVSGS